MNNINISALVRNQRNALGKTQLEVCEGICSESTMHRIENNGHLSSPYVMIRLLERLGYPKEMLYDTFRVIAPVKCESLKFQH